MSRTHGAEAAPAAASPSPLRWLRARLRARPDGEHEMSFNRLAFALVIVLYLLVFEGDSAGHALLVMSVYCALALGVLAHILWRPGVSRPRRLFALLLDMGFLSWQLHIGGEGTSLFVPIYLWVVFGNGFRFGIGWLHIAMAAGLVSFAAVVATTPFWRSQLHLSAGLWIGLLILPLYAGVLIRKLDQARQVAERASQAKTLFLASVSHELRTPLTAIIGMGALLRDTGLDRAQREMAGTIDGAAKSLLSLIDGILDFSRIEAGDTRTEAVEFAPAELLGEVRRMVTAQAREKGLDLAVHVTARTPLRLRGDRRHLQEILLNLAGNAVKFTAAGGVVLAADAAPLPDGRLRLRFEVTDTGIGIAPEAQARIFDSFTQADETIINRYGGTGLGLAISRRLAQLLGGEIGVESQPGAGSTFWFTALAAAMTAEAATAATPAAPLEGLGVVVLREAGATAADPLPAQLRALGAEAEPAGSVAQAVTLLRARAAEPPHRRIVLVDPRGLGAGPGALAQTLRGAGPAGGEAPPLVLLAEPPTGLPAVELRRDFACVIPPAPTRAELLAGLHAAAGPWARAAAGGGRPDQAPGDAAAPRRAARRLRILVADDNRINQKVISKVLESAGHETRTASNGEEALDALEVPGAFDLVLMDLNMPVMDGIEATKMFRVMSLGQPRVPVVALTADATPEAAARCLDAGMDACVTKPVEPSRLLDLVESLAPAPAAAEGAAATAGAAAATPEDEPPGVTEIASHPRFRPAVGPVPVDEGMLASLAALGGPEFLAGLIEEFLHEAAALVRDLETAVAAGDARHFRAQAHALGSSSANIGARGLAELCRVGQQIRAADFAAQAPAQTERVVAEFERVRRAFARPRAGAAAAQSGQAN